VHLLVLKPASVLKSESLLVRLSVLKSAVGAEVGAFGVPMLVL
jgi:hypothetical protein